MDDLQIFANFFCIKIAKIAYLQESTKQNRCISVTRSKKQGVMVVRFCTGKYLIRFTSRI